MPSTELLVDNIAFSEDLEKAESKETCQFRVIVSAKALAKQDEGAQLTGRIRIIAFGNANRNRQYPHICVLVINNGWLVGLVSNCNNIHIDNEQTVSKIK